MLLAGESQIARHVQTVPAANRPAGDDCDHDLGHRANQALDLEDVQSTGTGGVDGVCSLAVGVLVPRATANALIATRTERPPSVLGRGTVPGDEHAAHVRSHPSVVETAVELVDCRRSKGVAYLGPIEGDANGALFVCAVVGQVVQLADRCDAGPPLGLEDRGDRSVGHAAETRPECGVPERRAVRSSVRSGHGRVRHRTRGRRRRVACLPA